MKRLWLSISLLMLLTANAWAVHLPDDVEPGTNINDIALPLTKHTAAELAHIETNGKVLSVDEHEEQGKKTFRVKVLHKNGKVKIHRFDSETGHALNK